MFACLHYADVEEQMRQFKKLKHLSVLYPDVYGSLLDLWSIQTVEGVTNNTAGGGQPGGMYFSLINKHIVRSIQQNGIQ